MGANGITELAGRLEQLAREASAGRAPEQAAPLELDLHAPERVSIDFGSPAELAEKALRARQALAGDSAGGWKALRARGIFRGRGARPRVAFLYTGQGSQYVNMLGCLRRAEPVVASTFDEADATLAPLLGAPLSSLLFADAGDPLAVHRAEQALAQAAVSLPAVLTVDTALTRLLGCYGVFPDMVIGHSLGEYAALVSAGVLPFGHALEAVSARASEMTSVRVADPGRMAAVFAPVPEIERLLAPFAGRVEIANYNSRSQAVIGGYSEALDDAVGVLVAAGYNAIPLPVSHAFHTSVVASAIAPMRDVLDRLDVRAPRLPVVANVTGACYPGSREAIVGLLARQLAAPVRFSRGLTTLYEAGVRVFVELGPKKVLHGFVEDLFADDPSVLALFTNHPRLADAVAFNHALCGCYASGLGDARPQPAPAARGPRATSGAPVAAPVREWA